MCSVAAKDRQRSIVSSIVQATRLICELGGRMLILTARLPLAATAVDCSWLALLSPGWSMLKVISLAVMQVLQKSTLPGCRPSFQIVEFGTMCAFGEGSQMQWLV